MQRRNGFVVQSLTPLHDTGRKQQLAVTRFDGQRTIKLAYTQTIAPFGKKRRYVYPMAHSADGSTAAETFAMDISVAGARGISTFGYPMKRDAVGSRSTLSHSASSISMLKNITRLPRDNMWLISLMIKIF